VIIIGGHANRAADASRRQLDSVLRRDGGRRSGDMIVASSRVHSPVVKFHLDRQAQILGSPLPPPSPG
jgi:hypothetical protein